MQGRRDNFSFLVNTNQSGFYYEKKTNFYFFITIFDYGD